MNFEMHRGDSAAFDLTITKNAVAVNLTGSTLRFTAKRDKADPDADAIISKVSSDASQIEITNAAGGLATVHLVPADTEDLTEQTTLLYDVQVKDATNKVFTLVEGKLKIKLDVTQAA